MGPYLVSVDLVDELVRRSRRASVNAIKHATFNDVFWRLYNFSYCTKLRFLMGVKLQIQKTQLLIVLHKISVKFSIISEIRAGKVQNDSDSLTCQI